MQILHSVLFGSKTIKLLDVITSYSIHYTKLYDPFMQETLNDYGLKLVKFSIAAINIDDDELRRRYDEIGMDAISYNFV